MNKKKLRELKQQLKDHRYSDRYNIEGIVEALLEEEDDWSRARNLHINVSVLETENGYKISTAPLGGKRLEYVYDACLQNPRGADHLKFALRGALRKLADQLAEELEGEER